LNLKLELKEKKIVLAEINQELISRMKIREKIKIKRKYDSPVVEGLDDAIKKDLKREVCLLQG